MRLVIASACWVAGVYVGLRLAVPASALAMFLLASVALVPLFGMRRWSLLAPVALLLLLLGALRVELPTHSIQGLELYDGLGEVTVEGIVVGDPEARGSAVRFPFKVEAVATGDETREEITGKALVLAGPSAQLAVERSAPHIRYGDRLRLTGRLELPSDEGTFDYREYLARQGIGATMAFPEVSLLSEGHGSPVLSAVYRLRNSLARSLTRSLAEPQASLAQTLLLGKRGDIPEEVTQAFRDTGTSHLLAISGLHVGVVLALLLPFSVALLGRRRNLYLLLPLVILWLYAALSGFSPSVERAVIMASIYLLALALGRQRNSLPALAFAAALMVALDPNALYDISFQLSFTAVAGIILLAPTLQRVLATPLGEGDINGGWKRGVWLWLVIPAAVSMAAILATLPLLAFNFHRISLLSLPATLLALPMLPLALATSLATALVGLVSTPLGQGVGIVAWLPLSYILGIVEGLARIPQAVLHLESVAGPLVWAYYGGAAALILFIGMRQYLPGSMLDRALHWSPRPAVKVGTLLGLGAAVVLIWTANFALPDGKLRVTFLDVGQGDAIFVQGPGGEQVLIDGGPDPLPVLRALGERMPFWDRSLDLVVLSHADADHLGGLPEVLRRYRVAAVLDNPYLHDSPGWREWQAILQDKGATVVQAREGQVVKLGKDVVLKVLHPPEPPLGGTSADANNNATVLQLRYGDATFLFTGDVELAAELSMMGRGLELESTALKVAHHGSHSSTSEEFLEQVQPRLAVISAGQGNRFGHPTMEVMERLVGSVGKEMVFLTCRHGSVEVATDGRRLWVTTEKQGDDAEADLPCG